MGNMGSAHPLVEVNVSFKFEGNPSISKRVIERTQIGDGPTDATKRIQYSPPTFCGGGIKMVHEKSYFMTLLTHGILSPGRGITCSKYTSRLSVLPAVLKYRCLYCLKFKVPA